MFFTAKFGYLFIFFQLIKSAYVFTKKNNSKFRKNFWKGKMSGEEWKRCRTKNLDIGDLILKLSLYN